MTQTIETDTQLTDLLTQHATQCATIVQDTYFPVIERNVHTDMSEAYLTGVSSVVDGRIETVLTLNWRTPTYDSLEQAMRIIAERYFDISILAFAKRFTNR